MTRSVSNYPSEVELESVGCPLGCPRNDRTLFRGFDRLHGLPGEFPVIRCRGCGLMRTDPRPTRESIHYYYPPEYSPHRTATCQSTPRGGWRARLARGIDFRAMTIPPMQPGRLLELGCGSGAFLRWMASRGWTVEGIEPSPEAAEAARAGGVKVRTGGIEDAPEPGEPFDLIAAWMVLEHLHDPIETLRLVRRWARPESWLVLSVPNAGAFEFRLFRDAWYALQVPTHLYHFTPGSLARLLEKGGWTLERVVHQRLLSNLAASAGYWLADRKLANGLSRALIEVPDAPGRQHYWLYPLAVALGAVGQTGRMTAWARVGPGDPQ